MSQPLAGIKVADFSHVMAGPFCSHFLRLLGAEVVKVESIAGDPMRRYGPFRAFDGHAPAFIAANAGKRSVCLDLKSADGKEAARRLVAASDVVLENFRPGVMSRFGLGYEEAARIRPGIVYCSISGYGQSGRQRDFPAIDNIVQATSGMMAANGDEGDPPSRVGWPVVDTYTGTLGALAVLAALLRRERSSAPGQYIDLSMLDSSIVLMTALATPYLVTGQMLPRTGDTGYSGSPAAGLFIAGDGSRLSLGVVQNNQFVALCREIGRPDLAIDPRFASPVGRADPAHVGFLRAQLQSELAKRSGDEWERRLNAAGAPCGRVRDIGEACEDLRGNERGLLQPARLPDGTECPQAFVGAGFSFRADGPVGIAEVPALGQHTREVLHELGFGEQRVAEMLDRGTALAGDLA